MTRRMMVVVLAGFLFACGVSGEGALIDAVDSQEQAATTTLTFSGYTWTVKSGSGLGPGPNNWDSRNVWVDGNGWLHLKVRSVDGKWTCASARMTERLGFGRYQFQVIGAIDKLDKNVVLGLFDYPTYDVGVDGTNEIDIEIARWGNATGTNGNYVVFPAVGGLKQTSKRFQFSLNGTYTTHRFTRASHQVAFESLYGHVDGAGSQISSWVFRPTDPTRYVPQQGTPVVMNLWLHQGKPPSDGKEVEVIIRSFKFTPL